MVIGGSINFSDDKITAEALLKKPGFNEKPGFPMILEVVK